MTSTFSYILKSFGLAIFGSSIFTIFFRLLVLVVVIFFVLPMFYLGLSPLITRVQLFLLSALLCEFLSSKIYSVIHSVGEFRDKKLVKQKQEGISLALSNRKLTLFVHTKNVAIEKLMPKSMYKECASETGNSVRVFDHHKIPIVSIEMESLRQALRSFVIYPEFAQMLRFVKKSRSNIVTFVMSVKDLALGFSQKELFVAMHSFAFELGSFLDRKVSLNLIVEDTQSITGFDTFLKCQIDLDLMSFSFYASQKSTKDLIDIFEDSFRKFSDKIDLAIRCNNFLQPVDAQNVITFSQQIQYLKEPIKEVIASLVLISSRRSFFSNTLINVHFLSSFSSFAKNDVLSKELHSCLR